MKIHNLRSEMGHLGRQAHETSSEGSGPVEERKKRPPLLSDSKQSQGAKPQVEQSVAARPKPKYNVSDFVVPEEEVPNYANWIKLQSGRSSQDPDRSGNKLRNVHFYNCDRTGLTLENCTWENVLVAHCKFRKTTFRNLVLTDAVLVHLDFDNVTIFDLKGAFCCARNLLMQNALIGPELLYMRASEKRENTVWIKTLRGSSKTVTDQISKCSLSAREIRRIKEVDQSFSRVVSGFIRPSPHDRWTTLASDHNISNRIMRFCFPGTSVQIREYTEGRRPEWLQRARYVYTVNDCNTISGTRSMHTTAYFSCRSNGEVGGPKWQGTDQDTRYCGFATGMLLANKQLSKMALESLYKRSFEFKCSPEGVAQFMKVHRKHVQSISELQLHYHFKSEPGTVATGDESFHKLMCSIRHEFALIPSIKIHIGHGFWRIARWQFGPRVVIGQSTIRNDDERGTQPNFLWDVAKVAAPADCWQEEYKRSKLGAAGTRLQIVIEAAKDDKRMGFVESLHLEIERRRRERPLYLGRQKYVRTVSG